MRKIINAIETSGMGGANTLIMQFAVKPECVNLVEAVCKASLDFVNSSKGREVYEKNNKSFNWGDFWLHVPNSFCQRYGFTKLDDEGSKFPITVDLNEQLVDESDTVLPQIMTKQMWLELKAALIMKGKKAVEDFLGHQFTGDDVLEELDEASDEKLDAARVEFYEKYVKTSEFCEESLRRITAFLDSLTVDNPTDYHLEKTEEDLFNWIHFDKSQSAYQIRLAQLPRHMRNVLSVEEGWLFWYR